MKLEIRESGLAVAHEREQAREPIRDRYPPLEIQYDDLRCLAQKAMSDLWKAMELHGPRSSMVQPEQSQTRYDARLQAWRYIGNMILGEDCPPHEVRT